MAEESEPLIARENRENKQINAWCIKDLVPVKLCFLFQYAFIGSISPYITIYFIELGLTVSQAGYVNGLKTIFPIFIAPLFYTLAERTGRTKLIMQIIFIVKMVFVIIAPWLFPLVTMQRTSQVNINIPYTILNPNRTYVNKNENPNTVVHSFHYTLIIIAFAWSTIIAILDCPMVKLFDQSVIVVVRNQEKKSSYEFQRLFAPIGFAIGAFLSGVAVDIYAKTPYNTKYNAIFFCCLPSGFLFIIFSVFLHRAVREENLKKDKNSYKREVVNIFKNMEFSFFIVTVVILGINFALGGGFLVLLLDQLHTPYAVMGVFFAVASLTEVMIYPFSAKIKELIGGNFPCFIAAVFSYCLRFLLFSFTKNYLLILPIQLLHLIGYALFWSAVIEYSKEVVPRHIAATVSDIVVSLYYYFANVISNIVCGVLFQYVGGRLMLRIMAAANGIWGLVLLLFYMKYSNCLKKTDHQRKEYIAVT